MLHAITLKIKPAHATAIDESGGSFQAAVGEDFKEGFNIKSVETEETGVRDEEYTPIVFIHIEVKALHVFLAKVFREGLDEKYIIKIINSEDD